MENTSASSFLQGNISTETYTPQPSGRNYVYSTEVTIIIALLIGLVIVITVVGNLLVFIAFMRYKNLRTYHNYFILNLAIADFAIGLLCVPPYVPYLLTGVWPFGHAFCIVWLVLDYVTPCSSAVNILIVVVDMYLSVRNPFEHRRKQTASRARILMCIPWLVGLFVYGPAVVFWEHWFPSTAIPDSQCSVSFGSNLGYLLFGSTMEFIIPFLAVMVLNVLIFIRVNFHRQLPAASGDRESIHQHHKPMRKLFHTSQSQDPLPTARLSSNVTLASYQNFAFEEMDEANGAGQPRRGFNAQTTDDSPRYLESMGSSSHISRTDSRHSAHSRSSSSGMSADGNTNGTFLNENTQKPVDKSIVNVHTTHASRSVENDCKYTCQHEDLKQPTALNKSFEESDLKGSPKTSGELHLFLQVGASDTHGHHCNSFHSTCSEQHGSLAGKLEDGFDSIKSDKLNKNAQSGRIETVKTVQNTMTNNTTVCVSDKSECHHLCIPMQQQRIVHPSEVILDTTQLKKLQINRLDEANCGERANTVTTCKSAGNTQTSKRLKRRLTAHTRTAKAGVGLTLIVVVFGVCWAPFQISALIMALDPAAVNGNLFEVAFWLLWLNSTINPILYACVNWRFRIAFRMILCQKCSKNLDNSNLGSVA